MKNSIIIFILLFSTSNLFAFQIQSDTISKNSTESEARQKIKELLDLSEQNRNKYPEKSIAYAESAISIAQNLNDYELQYQTEFFAGFAQYSQNNFEKAIIHFNKSLEYSRLGNIKEGEAASLNRLGNTLQLMGKYQEALINYEQALYINRELDNTIEIARTRTNLGSIFRLYGNYEEAINQHLDALELYEGVKNNEGIAWSALNIARLFRTMKNYEKALSYVNKSLDIYQKIAFEQGINTGVTLCLKEIGDIYFEQGDLEKAIEFSEQVLQINKESQNWQGYANSLSTIGKIYFQSADKKLSKMYFTQSLQLKDSLNDNTEKASILRHLGMIALIEGNLPEAERYLKKSLDFAQKQNLKNDIKESYHTISEFYEKQNNPNKALFYYKSYIALKDSLNNQKINELELQYEFDKKQRQIEFEQKQKEVEQKARLQRQKIFIWVFVSGFIFMMLLAVIIFKNLQRKKQTNKILTQQNTIITDSIEYAKRIQTALMPQEKFMQQLIPNHFVFMKPKNIVSGDFYWLSEKDNKIIIAVSDCTGHGVPGAFMSMLGVAFLNEIVNKNELIDAGKILNQLRKNIILSLHQEYGVMGSKDGMDISLCIIDRETFHLQYAGAYNPVLIIRNGELFELKPDKMPIGIHAVKVDKEFSNKDFDLQSNDTLYLFTDGYIDQFGGSDGLKFRQKPFRELLLNIADKSMNKQKEMLANNMEKWQGDRPQLDDMMIMGIKF